ncbi:unnamed protein product [Dovyalis caffra]|uniref:BZIP domain-containing protein n=1 Tax=Dovyalis caffra TaxID=77055 RepID=A0AAV1SA60_9ROSI|nr:unnamed protein product [Dovyalis caffra]
MVPRSHKVIKPAQVSLPFSGLQPPDLKTLDLKLVHLLAQTEKLHCWVDLNEDKKQKMLERVLTRRTDSFIRNLATGSQLMRSISLTILQMKLHDLNKPASGDEEMRPDNSMEHQSEGLGGDQINDQTVQQSADQDRQNRKRASDRKYLDRKKQKTKDTERELETIKAEKAQLEKSNAYLKGQLDQLKEYVEQVRETHRRLEQIVEGQTTTIHMLQQLLQRPLERTLDNTSAIREAAQPVYNAPVPESGIPMRSDGSTMKNSLGMRQSRVPRGWPYGNGSELPAPTHDLTVDDYLVNDNGVIPVLK